MDVGLFSNEAVDFRRRAAHVAKTSSISELVTTSLSSPQATTSSLRQEVLELPTADGFLCKEEPCVYNPWRNACEHATGSRVIHSSGIADWILHTVPTPAVIAELASRVMLVL